MMVSVAVVISTRDDHAEGRWSCSPCPSQPASQCWSARCDPIPYCWRWSSTCCCSRCGPRRSSATHATSVRCGTALISALNALSRTDRGSAAARSGASVWTGVLRRSPVPSGNPPDGLRSEVAVTWRSACRCAKPAVGLAASSRDTAAKMRLLSTVEPQTAKHSKLRPAHWVPHASDQLRLSDIGDRKVPALTGTLRSLRLRAPRVVRWVTSAPGAVWP